MSKKFTIYPFDYEHLLSHQKHDNIPFKRIIEILDAIPQSCKTIIEERGYVDKDYQDEFAAFYCKAFKGHPSRCTRYHFFSCLIKDGDLLNISDFNADYLGFFVLRPIEHLSVGRTILKREPRQGAGAFTHCLAKFRAHILGRELTVTAMPFAQQDGAVGACAQTSLWMLARYMSAKFGDREFTPSHITTLAKQNTTRGRLYPADQGLDTMQILDALQGMGYPAEVFTHDALDGFETDIQAFYAKLPQSVQGKVSLATLKLANITYRYIESGLPVLFLTRGHVFVGIGHTLKVVERAEFSIERIPGFICNDDAAGPYCEVAIWEEVSAGKLVFGDVTEVITIVPQEVSLRGEEAESRARATLAQILERHSGSINKIKKRRPELKRWWSDRNLLYRTYLMKSIEWQRDLLEQKNKGFLNAKLTQLLLELDYPKYVWITEITTSALLNGSIEEEHQCLGFLVLDSTARRDSAACVLATHIFDTLTLPPNEEGQAKGWEFPKSTPFPPKRMARV